VPKSSRKLPNEEYIAGMEYEKSLKRRGIGNSPWKRRRD